MRKYTIILCKYISLCVYLPAEENRSLVKKKKKPAVILAYTTSAKPSASEDIRERRSQCEKESNKTLFVLRGRSAVRLQFNGYTVHCVCVYIDSGKTLLPGKSRSSL